MNFVHTASFLCFSAVWFLIGFKENLKLELAYQDLMIKELASLTGISRHTLDNYLNLRERIPTADVAVKIAKVLGISVEYLVRGTDDVNVKERMYRTMERKSATIEIKKLAFKIGKEAKRLR